MSKKTIKEMAKEWLEENGYDGLYNEGCGCQLNDLMPCSEYYHDCQAGWKVPCPGPEDCPADGDCDWHISSAKPAEIEEVKDGEE